MNNKYDANELLEMILAHQLGISTKFLKTIEERCDNESEKSEIYGILYEEDCNIDKAKEALHKKMTKAEIDCHRFINGEIQRTWILDLNENTDDVSYYNGVIDLPINPIEPAPEASIEAK